jgi:hypothetical protein
MSKEKRQRPDSAEFVEDKEVGSQVPEAIEPQAEENYAAAEADFDPESQGQNKAKQDELDAFDEQLPEYADVREGEDFQGAPEDGGGTGDEGDNEGGKNDEEDDPLEGVQYASYGMTEEQARKYAEEGRLDEILNAMDQRMMQAGQGYFPQQPAMPPMGPQMPPPMPMAPPPGMLPPQGIPPAGQQPPPGQFQFELNPEEFDPKFIEQMQAFNAQQQNRFSRMEQILVNMANHALEAGYARQGLPSPGESALRDRALRMVSNGSRNQAREEVKGEVEAMRGHMNRRPTQRKGTDNRTPEQRAIALAEKKLAKAGG